MTHEDIEIEKVLGLDIEPEDRDVGIFGNWFCIVLKTEDGRQLQLGFNEENINELVTILKPVIDELKNQQEMDRMEEK